MGWLFNKKKKILDLTENRQPTRQVVDGGITESEYRDLTQKSLQRDNQNNSVGNFFSAISGSSTQENQRDDILQLKHLKVKFEDIDYKVRALNGRIDKILDRLDLAEKKIDRVDRKEI